MENRIRNIQRQQEQGKEVVVRSFGHHALQDLAKRPGPVLQPPGRNGGRSSDNLTNLYIADFNNERIRRVANGVITTVAGNGMPGFSGDNGPATSAQLSNPISMAVDSAGNLYIADFNNNRIRRVANGVITTLAGSGPEQPALYGGDGGPATGALLFGPSAVALDSAGNVYIADTLNSRIRRISNGVITTVAGDGTFSFSGDDGPATSAGLQSPSDVAVDCVGNVDIADVGNHRVRKVSNGIITTVAGNGMLGSGGDSGPATSTPLDAEAIAADCAGNLYAADFYRVRKISNGVITTVAGNGTEGFSGDNGPAIMAQLSYTLDVTVDSAGNLYIAGDRIRKVSNGIITTVAGNGAPGFSGDDGPATSAQLSNPIGMAVDSVGNLYIADSGNNRIRKVSNGIITTVAGSGTKGFSGDNGPATSAQLNDPSAVAVDSSGNLYIDDWGNGRIRKVSNGIITTIAGNGTQGFSGDNGPAIAAQFQQGESEADGHLAVDSAGDVYIADFENQRVRILTPNIAPSITVGGIVPVGSTVSIIQSGSWVSIYGNHLASGNFYWNGDFPTSLGGTTVTINGKAAYLSFVSPTQINLQAPNDTATGPVPVVVSTSTGADTSTVMLAQFAPSFFLLDSRHVAGIISRSDGSGAYGGGTYDLLGPTGNSLGYPTVAAKAGDIIEVFGTGFGPTIPAVPAGQVFVGSAPTTNPVNLLIGNVSVSPSFSGLSGAGLYQINLTVPAGLGTGDVSFVAIIGGMATASSLVISVQQ